MPRPETPSISINIPVIIAGLRTQGIEVRDGIIYMGCIQGTLDEITNFTDQQILDSGSGQNAVDWWVEWKPILLPLFEKIIQDQAFIPQILETYNITIDEYNMSPQSYT